MPYPTRVTEEMAEHLLSLARLCTMLAGEAAAPAPQVTHMDLAGKEEEEMGGITASRVRMVRPIRVVGAVVAPALAVATPATAVPAS